MRCVDDESEHEVQHEVQHEGGRVFTLLRLVFGQGAIVFRTEDPRPL